MLGLHNSRKTAATFPLESLSLKYLVHDESYSKVLDRQSYEENKEDRSESLHKVSETVEEAIVLAELEVSLRP